MINSILSQKIMTVKAPIFIFVENVTLFLSSAVTKICSHEFKPSIFINANFYAIVVFIYYFHLPYV